MANTALFTNTDANVTLTTGDNYFLGEGITHFRSISGTVLTINGSGGNDVGVNGSLTTLGSGEVIDVRDGDANGVSITVGVTGSIIGSSDFRGILSDANRTVVSNSGLITGGEPIVLNGENSTVQNAGTIQNTFATNSFQAYAIQLNGGGATLMNAGYISGPRGVRLAEGGDVTNTGTIMASGTAVSLDAFNTEARVANMGTITSTQGNAIFGGASVQAIDNSGTINGTITLGAGDDILNNIGTIIGDINMGDNSNEVINAGTIVGDITFGSGEDTYNGSGNGLTTGDVYGGSGVDGLFGSEAVDKFFGGNGADDLHGRGGNDLLYGGEGLDVLLGGDGQDEIYGGTQDDTLRGGLGDDVLYGDAGNDLMIGDSGNDQMFGGTEVDRMIGGSGNDLLEGASGDDILRGGQGSDEMYGGTGEDLMIGGGDGDEMFGGFNNDRMFGGDGNDVLEGGDGTDRVLGESGDDVLVGGGARDNLYGGLGSDTFLFTAASDSASGTSEQDRIYDFTQGEDIIDLAAVFGGDLVFYGSGAFSGAAGIRLTETLAGTTLVDVDVNGDNVADMRIFVLGSSGMTVDDFIL